MPSVIPPLKKRKNSKFKKKPMASNKRWGKLIITQKGKNDD